MLKIAGQRPRLLIGTRKGAFFLDSSDQGKSWKLEGPHFLGHIIYHVVGDCRDKNIVLMAAKTGHLGPTVFASDDGGKTFKEASAPPAFAKQSESKDGEKGRSVGSVFWISAGHASEKSVWYAGTTPPGLFRSEDHGATWQEVKGFNDGPNYHTWTADGGGTPGGQMVHSIIVDPRDSKHMYLSISAGGTFESEDQGETWAPLNGNIAADFLPDKADYGHDPHCVVQHPAGLDRLYQQNHCGIYRIDRPSREWIRIGDNMPKEVGDIGFPMVPHPRDENRVWVFPMDGTSVWPRTSPGGKPAVYGTEDGGDSWQRLDRGLPLEHGYFTVKRQCMTADTCENVGLYFGTTSGEVWASPDEGANWQCIVRYLPEIYSLTTVEAE